MDTACGVRSGFGTHEASELGAAQSAVHVPAGLGRHVHAHEALTAADPPGGPRQFGAAVKAHEPAEGRTDAHLLDQVVQVLGDVGREALRLEDTQDGAAVHRLDLQGA